MKDCEKNNKRLPIQFRKHSISQKTRSDVNSNPFVSRDEPFSPFLGRGIKSMGRKYAQENLFKPKEKEHHQIVISDEVVRNSKIYRALRQKMEMKQALFVKECNQLAEIKAKIKQEISQIKSNSYNRKLTVWQLKNQILELKGILNDQQQENSRLQREFANPQNSYYEPQYEDEEQLANQAQQQMDQQNNNSSRSVTEGQQESVIGVHSVLMNSSVKMNPESGTKLKYSEQQEID